jgi:hypothetical protein
MMDDGERKTLKALTYSGLYYQRNRERLARAARERRRAARRAGIAPALTLAERMYTQLCYLASRDEKGGAARIALTDRDRWERTLARYMFAALKRLAFPEDARRAARVANKKWRHRHHNVHIRIDRKARAKLRNNPNWTARLHAKQFYRNMGIAVQALPATAIEVKAAHIRVHRQLRKDITT